jgi:hypothetical protein
LGATRQRTVARTIEHALAPPPTAPPLDDLPQHLVARLAALATTFVEMQHGLRPVTSLDAIASTAARRRILALTAGATHRRSGSTFRTAPIVVLRVHAMFPSAGAIESSVIVQCDGRVRAIALRLERWDAGWTLVEIAPPEGGLHAVITPASSNMSAASSTRPRSSTRPPARSPSRRQDHGMAEGRQAAP